MDHRHVITCDIPGAFMPSNRDELLHIELKGEIAELLVKVDPTWQQFMTHEHGKSVIYSKLNALYGMLQAALLFTQSLTKFNTKQHGSRLILMASVWSIRLSTGHNPELAGTWMISRYLI